MRIMIAAMLIVMSTISWSYAENDIKPTGTFTDFAYHKEAGDLLGDEIRIVSTKKGYQGTYQYSEGFPSELILLKNIKIENNNISFTISKDSNYNESEFVGKITTTDLIGAIIFSDGNKHPVNLKRAKSYWD